MDALSTALNSVHMTGAIFVNAEFTAPWGFKAPDARRLAAVVTPGAEHLVSYHLLTEGRATVRVGDDDAVPAVAGDIVIVPHGDGHVVSNGSPASLFDSLESLGEIMAGDVAQRRYGGGGETTNFVCGYFACERHAARLFLAGLPRLVKVGIRGDAAGAWLETSIRHLVSESESGRPGRGILLSKMAEALFVETLRRHMEQLPPEQTGWLGGARDSVVGAALTLMHRDPCRHWTIAELAAEAGASRSVLAERFQHFLGESPMAYLSRWRMQLAARLLHGERRTMLQVAMDVGYESEAAFNRAFKREFGLPPAQYRRKVAGNGGGTPHAGDLMRQPSA